MPGDFPANSISSLIQGDESRKMEAMEDFLSRWVLVRRVELGDSTLGINRCGTIQFARFPEVQGCWQLI